MARPHRNYINGEWIEAPDTVANIDPSDTNDNLGLYAQADESQANDAIAAARAAFPSWRDAGIQARSDLLRQVGETILARRDELGRLLSREEGKTLPEGIGEVVRAGQIFLYFSGEALRNSGDVVESVRPGLDADARRQPLGVVGLITPWNFPAAIPAWKAAPALAFGNTVVLKPAELVPASAVALAEIIQEAGAPAGVFNLVCGAGSVVGEAMLKSPDVDAVSFTGSVATGRRVAAQAVAGMKKFQLEMGGKNPLVVLNDADMDIAVDCAVQGAFFSTGQRCTASSRLIVEKGVHDAFVDRVIERLASLKVGHALEPATDIGPVVNQSQLDTVQGYIEIGRKEGAELAFGGDVLERETPGFFMAPALFVGARNRMRISREEIFGPVATVLKAEDYDDALRLANDTEFGLSSGICTSSLKYAHHFRRNAEAGMVMVNLPTAGVDYHVPFGGVKGSSYGAREQGTFAREFYTSVKTSYLRTQ